MRASLAEDGLISVTRNRPRDLLVQQYVLVARSCFTRSSSICDVCGDLCLLREYGIKPNDLKGDPGTCVSRDAGYVVPPHAGKWYGARIRYNGEGSIRKLEAAILLQLQYPCWTECPCP